MNVTVTTREAAEMVGVSVRTVEQWVRRGYLTPCNRTDGARPRVAKYLATEVIECAHDRRSRAWRDRLDRLAEGLGLTG